MKVNKGLGKGLSALFAETEEDYGSVFGGQADVSKEGVSELNIDDVYPNPDQPRKVFDQTALYELADSISKHGVIMPIVVNKEGGRYMIIAGERRYRASKIAGKTTIPAVIKNYNEREIKEISLIENLQREDLNPIEAAMAMRQLMDEYHLTQEELSERIGKSRSAVANTLRLLTLSPNVITLISENKLSAGHARAMITLPQAEQELVANKVVSEGISVRDVEKTVRDYFNPPEDKIKKKREEMSVELKDMIARMQRDFGTKVSAIGNDHKGRIYIDYYTRDDLDRICDILDLVEKENNK
ncbi:MAG: ParB/RepB/Spo0J family partition protein [Clostridia bacterium]|nr:ParB/RepB/Spo0J family partition protein [Clostridia bacterium]